VTPIAPVLLQGTTGALILARTKHMARELSRQFRTHSIAKTYLALVVQGGEPGLGNGAWTGGVADGPGASARTGLITNPLRVDDDGRVSAGSSSRSTCNSCSRSRSGYARGRSRADPGTRPNRRRQRQRSQGRADGVGGPRFFGQFFFSPCLCLG